MRATWRTAKAAGTSQASSSTGTKRRVSSAIRASFSTQGRCTERGVHSTMMALAVASVPISSASQSAPA